MQVRLKSTYYIVSKPVFSGISIVTKLLPMPCYPDIIV